MKTTDVIAYYGTKKAIAKALNCWHTTISAWGEYPPMGRQYELQEKTNGALKVTPKDQQGGNHAA